MWPLPASPGDTTVHRAIHAASTPPTAGVVLSDAGLLVLIVTVIVLASVWVNDTPVRSRLSPAGVDVPLPLKNASPSGSVLEFNAEPGPSDGWMVCPLRMLDPPVWRTT